MKLLFFQQNSLKKSICIKIFIVQFTRKVPLVYFITKLLFLQQNLRKKTTFAVKFIVQFTKHVLYVFYGETSVFLQNLRKSIFFHIIYCKIFHF